MFMLRTDRIDLKIAVNVQTRVWGVLGILAGLTYSIVGLAHDFLASELSAGTALAFFAVIGMPFLFAVFGALSAFVGGFLHNVLFARG